jgi:hypothetical protein
MVATLTDLVSLALVMYLGVSPGDGPPEVGGLGAAAHHPGDMEAGDPSTSSHHANHPGG